MNTMTESLVRYESPAAGIARLVLSRADKHNAINPQMIFELNEAFNRALYDDAVKVIILAADGKNFSAGHDIARTVEADQSDMQHNRPRVSTWSRLHEAATHRPHSAAEERHPPSTRPSRHPPQPTH